jgi:tRNA(Ile)-lysidine synthase
VPAILPIPPPWPDARALVGVSGGRDSVALLHALKEGGWKNLTVCHLDHALRARSAADAQFVARLAAEHGFPAAVARVDVAALAAREAKSIETAAREARYGFFAQTARACGSSLLFLGHHADDQVETFLFRLLRGAGPCGLGAMRNETDRTVEGTTLRIRRPFLGIWRAEIDAYVAAHALPFREDTSNAERHHTRNRLRHDAIPALEAALGRGVRQALWRAAEIIAAEDELIAAQPELQPPLAAELATGDVAALPLALQRRILHRWLRDRGVPDVGFDEVERVRSLLVQRFPAKVNLPGGSHARRRAGRLFVE